MESLTNSKKDKNSIEVEISGLFSKKKIIFKDDFLEYRNKKISYNDIIGISYIAISTSINFIPVGTQHKFTLTTKKDEISLSLKKDEWMKLINISKQLIEPILIQHIVKQIFEENHEYEIGGVTFNNKGYYKNKFFGGIKEVLWKDEIFIPQYSEGCVIIFKEKNGGGKEFASISMSEENAVLLPELIEICANYFNYKNNKKHIRRPQNKHKKE